MKSVDNNRSGSNSAGSSSILLSMRNINGMVFDSGTIIEIHFSKLMDRERNCLDVVHSAAYEL